MSVLERRFTQTTLRAVPGTDAGSPGTVIGYAARCDVLSHDLGGFHERIAPGAFDRSISSGDDCYACMNHDPSLLLGRRRNRTLELFADRTGLRMSCQLPNTSVGRDAFALISRGDVDEMSFAFEPLDEDWNDEDDPDDRSRRIRVRTLKDLKLRDVACVSSPAYPGTSVSATGVPFHNSAPARSFESLFPAGVPAEIRARIADAKERYEDRSQSDAIARRRQLVNLIFSA
jgi:HK97 family phage prohead protease